MTTIRTSALPDNSLLARYDPHVTPAAAGGYVDSFACEVAKDVSLADFVYAFYTTPVFRLERWILALAGLPSTDREARQVAGGESSDFAAWRVEARNENELLMCDVRGHTRSWFKVTPASGAGSTRILFGSAVLPIARDGDGKPVLGRAYRLLLGFHRLYSRVLLRSAARRLP